MTHGIAEKQGAIRRERKGLRLDRGSRPATLAFRVRDNTVINQRLLLKIVVARGPLSTRSR